MSVVQPTITAPLILGEESNYSFTQLTAPGTTDALQVKTVTNHTIAVTVAAIDTNVVVRIEGSLDGTNWANLSDVGDTTITGNGTEMFFFKGKLNYIRGNFVSESGGTAATVNFVYSGDD